MPSFLNKKTILQIALTFGKAFFAVFLLGVSTILNDVSGGHWSTGKDALVALLIAAGTAGLHAVEAYAKSQGWLGFLGQEPTPPAKP